MLVWDWLVTILSQIYTAPFMQKVSGTSDYWGCDLPVKPTWCGNCRSEACGNRLILGSRKVVVSFAIATSFAHVCCYKKLAVYGNSLFCPTLCIFGHRLLDTNDWVIIFWQWIAIYTTYQCVWLDLVFIYNNVWGCPMSALVSIWKAHKFFIQLLKFKA